MPAPRQSADPQLTHRLEEFLRTRGEANLKAQAAADLLNAGVVPVHAAAAGAVQPPKKGWFGRGNGAVAPATPGTGPATSAAASTPLRAPTPPAPLPEAPTAAGILSAGSAVGSTASLNPGPALPPAPKKSWWGGKKQPTEAKTHPV